MRDLTTSRATVEELVVLYKLAKFGKTTKMKKHVFPRHFTQRDEGNRPPGIGSDFDGESELSSLLSRQQAGAFRRTLSPPSTFD